MGVIASGGKTFGSVVDFGSLLRKFKVFNEENNFESCKFWFLQNKLVFHLNSMTENEKEQDIVLPGGIETASFHMRFGQTQRFD